MSRMSETPEGVLETYDWQDVAEDLQEKIDKAIEYIKGHTDKLKTIRVPKIDFDYKKLLEILGDKDE